MNPSDHYDKKSRSLSATTNSQYQQYNQYPPMSSTQAQYTLSAYPAQTHYPSSANQQISYTTQPTLAAQIPASYSVHPSASYPSATASHASMPVVDTHSLNAPYGHMQMQSGEPYSYYDASYTSGHQSHAARPPSSQRLQLTPAQTLQQQQMHPRPMVHGIHPSHSPPVDSTERFKCEACGRDFSRAHDRKRHYESQHSRNPVLHKCPYCKKDFSRADSMKRHVDNGCDKDPSTNPGV